MLSFPYDKLCNPVDALRNWQYVDRLCARYEEEHSILINREYFGVLTASLIEPSLAIVVNIIQGILSAQQGCRSITVGYAEQGNRSQDIAAIRVLNEMVKYYLQLFGYRHCRVTTVFHQYMAAFPSDYQKAEELIFNSCITATKAGATKVMVKTAVEAIKIPDKHENKYALDLCRKAALSAADVPVFPRYVSMEQRMLRKEVKQIMDVILELGNNSIAVGAVKAIEYGIIDVPWSPSIYNHNKVMGVHDVNGAVRFLNFGNLPFDEEVKAFHYEKVNLRMNTERDSMAFSLLEKDLSRIWKNDYKHWPLDNSYIV
jgi:methylaspartate mutase epsilon subunit